jgi:drug/metabolite transporter (DMT)-like permease
MAERPSRESTSPRRSVRAVTAVAVPHRTPVAGSALAVGAGVVWSFGAIAAQKADGADPFQYLMWRSIGIMVVIEVISHLTGRGSPTIRAYTSGRTMLAANLAFFIASFGYIYAVKTTAAANAAFLASTTPIFAALLGVTFLRERLSRVTIVTIAVAFAGLLLTVLGDLEAGSVVGNLAAMSSAFGFALYTIVVRTDAARDWSPALSGYGVVMVLVCGGVTVAGGNTLVPPLPDIALALLHGGVFIVVGTLMYNAASRHVPAAPMTIFAQTEMVLVPVWALLVLGERPAVVTLIGGGLILGAILFKAFADARSARAPAPPPSFA